MNDENAFLYMKILYYNSYLFMVAYQILGKMAPTVMKTSKKSESTKFKRTRQSIVRKLKIFEKHAKA